MNPATKTVRCDSIGRDVAVKELTVNDKRDMLMNRELLGGEDDAVTGADMLLEIETAADGVLLSDLPKLSDLTSEESQRLTEADQDKVIALSKELNPRFFSRTLAPIWVEFARSLGSPKGPETSGVISSEPSSPSSEPDTLTPGATH